MSALHDTEEDFSPLPEQMRNAQRWLLWKSEPSPDPMKKPRKVPYYADGQRRNGALDSPADIAKLVPLVDALRAFKAGRYTGLGFALGPDGTGNCWQGIDLDNLSERPALRLVADELPGYTETSPSGNGMHAIGYGRHFDSLGSNSSGIEAYARGRFFTVTAADAGLHSPTCLASFVEQRLAASHSPPQAYKVSVTDNTSTPCEVLQADTIAALRSALLYMRADDRDLWQRMGHALKTIGDTGRGLWLEWSATSEKFDPAGDARTWESFNPTRTNYKAVFTEAQRGGWLNPQSNVARVYFDGDDWPEPQPLTAKVEPEPYPLDALPDTIRAAVEEVLGFTKAPVPLVASSSLAALSLASQAHIDMKRAERLQGPVGLFLLTIADSGERKSTCDGFFMKAIHDYDEAQAEVMKPILRDYSAAIEAWESKRGGIKDGIRKLTKSNRQTADMESALRDLEHYKPEPPRIPRLLYTDVTPEALAYGLAKQWPSGGVVSAEAGIVFGSHGMGKDSVMRNLGLLNQLWDGASLTIDRRTSDSFSVRGARLTVALQVQEPTLREFFARSGALARGTGFLARFLVAWPESTQGFRLFTDAPANWPHLDAFNRRIAAILSQSALIDDDGALTPPMLNLTPDAKAAWVTFHDEIERELASGGELYDVRDVASKSADNAARLAALFQMFEHGMGAVGPECFESASRIAAWHLNESRRFFGELALPAEMVNTARLDTWLIEYCRRQRTHLVGKNHARQHGPLRDGAALDAAIRELADLDRVRLAKDGKRRTILVNPVLLIEVGAS